MAKEVPIENIYFLLIYAWNKLREAEQINVNQISNTDLINLLSSVFSNCLKYLIQKSLDRCYIEDNEDTKSPRGKINLSTSIKRNLIKNAQVNCGFDELSHNVLHNQILKTTISKLLKNSNLDKDLKRDIRCLYFYFNDIQEIQINNSVFKQVLINRNNFFYDFPLKISELIYRFAMMNEKSGDFKFKNFMRDKLPYLFEEFIKNFYKIELPKLRDETKRRIFPELTVIGSEFIKWDFDFSSYKSSELLPIMKTDVSIINKNVKLIIDTKFYRETLVKHYEKKKIRSSHLYQLFTYLKNDKHETKRGLLLYPTTDEEIDEMYPIQDLFIRIKTINLSKDWHDIHNDLINIAKSELLTSAT